MSDGQDSEPEAPTYGGRTHGIDLEVLRRRIFVMKSRGMSMDQIAKSVGKAKSTVQHHLKEIKREKLRASEGAGTEELTGELLLLHDELLQESLRNMTLVEQGTPMRQAWLSEAKRHLESKEKFMLTVGLIRRADPQDNEEFRDLKRMSDEEIKKEVEQLKRELAKEPVDLNAPKIPALN